jgi:hypothetical protein
MTLRFRGGLFLATIASAVVIAGCSGDNAGTAPTPPGAADLNADIVANRTLHAETTYTLTSFVHVEAPATLTIEPGTTIKGRTGSALFIMRGAKINATGRADAPVVFTSDQPVGSRKPGDWGGLVLIGNGIINRAGVVLLEGTGTPTSNPTIEYGNGTNNADNSGVLRYVRVEFAGFGVANDQELNSFTLAAVGSGTEIDHVQALGGLDDAFEWFGGAVDARYLVSYETADDHFDAAEGYVGRVQYMIAFQSTILEPRAGSGVLSSDPQGFEIDGCGSATASGCTQGYNSTPLNIPMFANFTMIGTGPNNAVQATSGGNGMVLRRGTGGYYVNGVVARWPRAAISLRDPETQTRITNGELLLKNISVVEIGVTAGTNAPVFEGGTACPAANCRFTIDVGANALVSEAGTVTTGTTFAAIPLTTVEPTAATLDFSLATNAAARTGGTGAFTGTLATKGGTVAIGTTFRGAWSPDGSTGKWWQGWTNYARR